MKKKVKSPMKSKQLTPKQSKAVLKALLKLALPEGKYAELKSPGGGKLVYACIGNYRGKGRQRLILHEVTVDYENQTYSYGDKKTWNFPTGRGRKKAVK